MINIIMRYLYTNNIIYSSIQHLFSVHRYNYRNLKSIQNNKIIGPKFCTNWKKKRVQKFIKIYRLPKNYEYYKMN